MNRRAGAGRAVRAALAGCLLLVGACQPPAAATSSHPAESGLAAAIADAAVAQPDLAAIYSRRGDRPIWLSDRSAVAAALAMLAGAGKDGLDPARYGAARITRDFDSANGNPARLANVELSLSRAIGRYLSDLRTPAAEFAPAWRDPGVAARTTDAAALIEEAARAPSPSAWLATARRMHPLYEEARAGGATREALDRLRALPADPGERYVLVDADAAELRMIEHGAVVDRMKVVVGKPGMSTPPLAGLIRYATLNPYWNLPPDLAAGRAERILFDGPALLEAQRLEAVSDWSPDGQVLDPLLVDWSAMAAQAGTARLRQLPGSRNTMGAVKFMLPNPLGIYLHDTPDRWAFRRASRRLSSGCVRLEDAARFGRWLFGGRMPMPSGAPEQRVDLPRAVPVYIIARRSAVSA